MARAERRPTERPTPRRVSGAREQGQVAVSADLSAALALAALVTLFAALAPAGFQLLAALFRDSLGLAAAAGRATGLDFGPPRAVAGVWRAGEGVAPLFIVPLAVVVVGTLTSGAIQTGGLFAWKAVSAGGRRPSPAEGLKRILGPTTLVLVAKTAVKVAIVLLAATISVAPWAGELPRLAGARPASLVAALGLLGQRVMVHVALACVGWGIIDWLITRHQLGRALMMTREEARWEHRETDGDPEQRAERRRLHRETSGWRTDDDPSRAVRAARVVVVNGSGSIAVALSYAPEDGIAPTVVAKGERVKAGRIRRIAEGFAVPIHADGALALALTQVPDGDEIPEALFEAVAELLRQLPVEGNRLEEPAG